MDDAAEPMVFEAPPIYRRRRRALPADKPWINLLLFVLTVVSTWITWGGWYSAAVVAILLAHEMGHYIAAKRHHIPATLPFFIPFPYANPFGTLGAMIQLHGHFADRRTLFDVGAAGPLSGLLVSIPVIILGIAFDPLVARSSVSTAFLPNPQPLMQLISWLMTGSLLSATEIMLNPVIYAGWVGLFVTSLNLIPVGQLDGGHVFYSVVGRRSLKWMLGVIGLLGVLAIFYHGWLLLFVLLLLFGRRHPPPLDDFTPLDARRRRTALLLLIIFSVTFSPFPFTF